MICSEWYLTASKCILYLGSSVKTNNNNQNILDLWAEAKPFQENWSGTLQG